MTNARLIQTRADILQALQSTEAARSAHADGNTTRMKDALELIAAMAIEVLNALDGDIDLEGDEREPETLDKDGAFEDNNASPLPELP